MIVLGLILYSHAHFIIISKVSIPCLPFIAFSLASSCSKTCPELSLFEFNHFLYLFFSQLDLTLTVLPQVCFNFFHVQIMSNLSAILCSIFSLSTVTLYCYQISQPSKDCSLSLIVSLAPTSSNLKVISLMQILMQPSQTITGTLLLPSTNKKPKGI